MQPLDVEGVRITPESASNFSKASLFGNEARVLFYAFAASLGFLSMGYHLSVFNSASFFLWQGCKWEMDFNSFKNMADTALAFAAFFVCVIISFNKIKFRIYTKLLNIADLLTLIGTLLTFTIFSTSPNWILLGRILAGLGIGIDVAIILPFVREMQFYLSESNFKAEKRRFFVEVFFALGIFLGIAPSQLLNLNGTNEDYIENQNGFQGNQPGELVPRPDLLACFALCMIPIISSIGRSALLFYLGDTKPPQYAPMFTDEGLSENFEEDETQTERLGMLKFKETRSLIKLLREPYKRRLELCYILHFLQTASGFVVFIVNSLYIAVYLKRKDKGGDNDEDIQYTILEFAAVYLVTTILSSLLFTLVKLPRRAIMVFSAFISLLLALAMGVMGLLGRTEEIKLFMICYWLSVCIGMGPVVELFIEEVIPGKGLQFLLSVKWLLIGSVGLLTRYSLRNDSTYTLLYFFFSIITAMSLFVLYDLMPETAYTAPQDIHKLFQFEGEPELTEQ